MVLRGLGRDRLSGAQAERLSRSRLSLRILRYHRNQYVVLPAAAPRALPAVDRASRPIPDLCSRPSSGRNSRMNRARERKTSAPSGQDLMRCEMPESWAPCCSSFHFPFSGTKTRSGQATGSLRSCYERPEAVEHESPIQRWLLLPQIYRSSTQAPGEQSAFAHVPRPPSDRVSTARRAVRHCQK